MKRLVMSNTGPNGTLDTDNLQCAVLQYHNCPDHQTKLSPAMTVFGRPVKDFIPILPGRYKPHPTWQDILATREEALRNYHMHCKERLSVYTRRLPPLAVGDYVRVQNQVGPNPTRWDKTGVVIEVKQYNQHNIRMDGSGRITLRNRKFLHKFSPANPRPPKQNINEDLPQKPGKEPIQTTREFYNEAIPTANNTDEHDSPATENQMTETQDIPNATITTNVPASTTPDQQRQSTSPPNKNKMTPLALRHFMDLNKKGLKE